MAGQAVKLYHWAPQDRRDSIAREGLKPRMKPTMNTLPCEGICLSADPSTAWTLSAGLKPELEWDCWVVDLPINAEVHVLPYFHPGPIEYRIHTDIPWHAVSLKQEERRR